MKNKNKRLNLPANTGLVLGLQIVNYNNRFTQYNPCVTFINLLSSTIILIIPTIIEGAHIPLRANPLLTRQPIPLSLLQCL